MNEKKAVKENIFVFGDVSKTKIHEVKNIPSMKFLAPFLYDNIMDLVQGQPVSHPIPNKLPAMLAISLGPKTGIFVMGDKVEESEVAAKSKYDYTDSYIKMYGGNVDMIQKQKAYLMDTYKQLSASIVY